jgi:hypothetical protein
MKRGGKVFPGRIARLYSKKQADKAKRKEKVTLRRVASKYCLFAPKHKNSPARVRDQQASGRKREDEKETKIWTEGFTRQGVLKLHRIQIISIEQCFARFLCPEQDCHPISFPIQDLWKIRKFELGGDSYKIELTMMNVDPRASF